MQPNSYSTSGSFTDLAGPVFSEALDAEESIGSQAYLREFFEGCDNSTSNIFEPLLHAVVVLTKEQKAKAKLINRKLNEFSRGFMNRRYEVGGPIVAKFRMAHADARGQGNAGLLSAKTGIIAIVFCYGNGQVTSPCPELSRKVTAWFWSAVLDDNATQQVCGMIQPDSLHGVADAFLKLIAMPELTDCRRFIEGMAPAIGKNPLAEAYFGKTNCEELIGSSSTTDVRSARWTTFAKALRTQIRNLRVKLGLQNPVDKSAKC